MPSYKKNQEYTKFKLRVGPQGRIVIPAPMRNALDIRPGSVIEGWVEGNKVVLIPAKGVEKKDLAAIERAEKRLWKRFKDVKGSMSAELKEERREEARREARRAR